MPVYLVDKPLRSTSHDVVAGARRLLRTRRVGHAGTLDPLASGLLVLLTEEDTKLSPFLSQSRKRYLAWVSFGATTATLDAEGPLLDARPTERVDASRIEAVLPKFLQVSEQVPPLFSAVKRQGVKGYEAARKGEPLELTPRPVGYHWLELLAFARERSGLPDRVSPVAGRWLPQKSGRKVPLPEPLGAFPSALISLEVRAGTYVRAFARDLAGSLGTSAFLSGLLRTGSGALDLATAVSLDDLPTATPVRAAEALPYPKLSLDADEAARVRKGQRLPLSLAERTVLTDPAGELVAVAEEHEGRMKLVRVWGGS
jgi:tRNA pseudouridine55 synthase